MDRKQERDAEQKRRHDNAMDKLKEARERHERWLQQQFGNRKDVLRDAEDIVRVFEAEHGYQRGTVAATFDEHGSHLGYRLVVHGRFPDEADLIGRIRDRTGETFEVDHLG